MKKHMVLAAALMVMFVSNAHAATDSNARVSLLDPQMNPVRAAADKVATGNNVCPLTGKVMSGNFNEEPKREQIALEPRLLNSKNSNVTN